MVEDLDDGVARRRAARLADATARPAGTPRTRTSAAPRSRSPPRPTRTSAASSRAPRSRTRASRARCTRARIPIARIAGARVRDLAAPGRARLPRPRARPRARLAGSIATRYGRAASTPAELAARKTATVSRRRAGARGGDDDRRRRSTCCAASSRRAPSTSCSWSTRPRADGTARWRAPPARRWCRRTTSCPPSGRAAARATPCGARLAATTGEIVAFVDTDTEDFAERVLTGLLGAALRAPRAGARQGRLPAARSRSAASVRPDEGGRVTELMARPLLNLHRPALAGFAPAARGRGRRAPRAARAARRSRSATASRSRC